MLVGVPLCFFGRRLFKPAMFISGIVVIVFLTFAIFYGTFLKENTQGWVGWVVLICAILVGSLFGFILTKVVKLGAFILAAWGGFCLALLLYNSFFYYAFEEVGLYCFATALAIVFGVLAVFFFDHVIINATALAGSYLIIDSIGMVVGRY